MVRLVFRPYTQISRSICTSEPLRASTRVSPGFTLFRHSSPSFGSQHVCSNSNLSPKIMIGRWCPLWKVPTSIRRTNIHFHYAPEFDTQTLAHMLDSLVRVSRRAGYNHFVHIVILQFPKDAKRNITPQSLKVWTWKAFNSGESTFLSTRLYFSKLIWTRKKAQTQIIDQCQMPYHDTSCNLFPFSDFRYSFTLFSKCFASFPHGTCSLSVSRQYLALEGIYLLLWAAVPSNSTRWKQTVR